MKNKLERIWKEEIIPELNINLISPYLLQGLSKPSARIVGVLAEIRT
jgi:hypothetical protein